MILVLGSVPPPIGGVSVFVERRVAALRRDGQRVEVHALRPPLALIQRLVRLRRKDVSVIEVHSLRLSIVLMLAVLGLLGMSVFYDHNHSRRFQASGRLALRVMGYFLCRARCIRIVSDHLATNYDIFDSTPCLEVVEPDVMPDTSNRDQIVLSYPAWVREFWAQGSPRIILGAWRPVWSDGGDLYGLFAAVKLAAQLVTEHADMRMLITVADPMDGAYLKRLRSEIEAQDLTLSVRILEGQYPMWPLIETSHVFLRPTLTDGNSVSVLEALSFGVAVVASDCVDRPTGVSTYTTADQDSLLAVVTETLNSLH